MKVAPSFPNSLANHFQSLSHCEIPNVFGDRIHAWNRSIDFKKANIIVLKNADLKKNLTSLNF